MHQILPLQKKKKMLTNQRPLTKFRTNLRHQYGILGLMRRRLSRETSLSAMKESNCCIRRLSLHTDENCLAK